jgi:hypothetical protein
MTYSHAKLGGQARKLRIPPAASWCVANFGYSGPSQLGERVSIAASDGAVNVLVGVVLDGSCPPEIVSAIVPPLPVAVGRVVL